MSKVLLVAPSCDGTDVGEAWVAHQWAAGLSERHDLTVLTYRGVGRPSAVPQLPGARVVEWDQPSYLGRVARFNSLLKPWYPLFHRHCRRWIQEARSAGERFDVAHQPVPVAMRYPSPLAGTGVPYVIGPVGGSLVSPSGFEDEDTSPWYVGLRRLDGWRMQHDRVLRRSYEQAAVVLGIAPYVSESLSSLRLRDLRFMSETALTRLPDRVDRSQRTGPVRLLFVGRVIRTKGVRDAVAAMQHLQDLPVHLDVVGDGFDRADCEALARRLGVAAQVTFHGALPRQRVDEFYAASDIFVFPSFREPGGNVQFEAMGFGLPLVISDRGGPANVVDEACGVQVTPQNPVQYAVDLATAIRTLVSDPDRRRAMGIAARRSVELNGTWAARIAQIEDVYDSVIGTETFSRPGRTGHV